jgi:acetolactate synthase-1/2/3 large subunit
MIEVDVGIAPVDVERVPTLTVAEAFLRLLRSRGISNFYVNAGTDFAPLLEAYATLADATGDSLPRPVVAAHENLAMGMAHGAYLMSGNVQAVMFHVSVGTANAACAALNAAAERVPILIAAGRTPVYESGRIGARNTRVAWAQEMFDQSALVREAVKWDYELRGPVGIDEVIDRALTLAMTQPRGPVYLTLPREVLAGPAEAPIAMTQRELRPATPPHPDPVAVGRLADALTDARMPVISSLASGAEPETVEALSVLCDRFAIGYVEEQARYLNLPSDHPLHLGYSMAPVLRDVDALCVIDSDVPWIPEFGEPRADAFVAQCGADADFSRYPIRGHRRDLAITATPTTLLAALTTALEQRQDRIDPARRDRLTAKAAQARAATNALRDAELVRPGPITTRFVSATLAGLLHDNCTLFNEYSVERAFVSPRAPRSYFYLPATGGLGWALPAALGAKLEAPERTMVAVMGDGTYMFSNPAACHHASRKHGLPVLTVVCNNARWNAVDATARLVYPAGRLTELDRHSLSDLSPTPAFEMYAEASGGYGELVTERADLAAALRRGLDAVERHGRQALINVICS